MPSTQSATAFAPASVGNMIAGFDILGLALEQPGDEVTVRIETDGPDGVHMGTVEVAPQVPDAEAVLQKLPRDAAGNLAGYVVSQIWSELAPGKRPRSISVDLRKGLGVGTGLGSSAASAAAAALAGLKLLSDPTLENLIEYGMRGETLASGARHGDNLAPALLGGIVGTRSLDPPDVFHVPVPKQLHCALVHPRVTVLTKDAREAIPKELGLSTHVEQSANLASLIAGLYDSDYARISRSLVDVVAEPHRKAAIPEFEGLREDALSCGALACGIAGSGPTVFALCVGQECAQKVCAIWSTRYRQVGVPNTTFDSPVSPRGAYLV